MADMEVDQTVATTKKEGKAKEGKQRFEVKKVISLLGLDNRPLMLLERSGTRSPCGRGVSRPFA